MQSLKYKMYYLIHAWEIILVLFVLHIFFVFIIKKPRNSPSKNTLNIITNSSGALTIVPTAVDINNGFPNEKSLKAEDSPLKQTSSLQQLQLALLLTEKALPVWEKYVAGKEFIYYTSAADYNGKIESNLLEKSIKEIKLLLKTGVTDFENKNIKKLYNDFISPVIALQDGVWVTVYPVKKIFMSVYYILKSIVEKTTSDDKENFLSIGIGYATDCLNLSKLYSSDEVTSFLEMHNSSQ